MSVQGTSVPSYFCDYLLLMYVLYVLSTFANNALCCCWCCRSWPLRSSWRRDSWRATSRTARSWRRTCRTLSGASREELHPTDRCAKIQTLATRREKRAMYLIPFRRLKGPLAWPWSQRRKHQCVVLSLGIDWRTRRVVLFDFLIGLFHVGWLGYDPVRAIWLVCDPGI